ncbi:unnamed protein product [marine sediment metagenome]|uniref:Uncharacterized protein n=1 Tax=marine sediment metagenome TaxID=412755 RepID=X0TXX3_9ZZZZ
MPGGEIKLRKVDNIKTKSAIRILTDKGVEISRELVTQVTFEGELSPDDIAQIHRLLKSGAEVNVTIWSPQLSMKLAET